MYGLRNKDKAVIIFFKNKDFLIVIININKLLEGFLAPYISVSGFNINY